MSMLSDIEGLTARYEGLRDGHVRHVRERDWLRMQRRRLVLRDHYRQRCGQPVDTEDEDLALLGMKLGEVIATLERAEEAERQERCRVWMAGADRREHEAEKTAAREAQAARDHRRPLTAKEKAQLRADGYRVDEDLVR